MARAHIMIIVAGLALSALPAHAQSAESAGLAALPEPVLDPNGEVIPYDGKKPVVDTPAAPARKTAAKKTSKKKGKKQPAKKKAAARTPKKTTKKAKP